MKSHLASCGKYIDSQRLALRPNTEIPQAAAVASNSKTMKQQGILSTTGVVVVSTEKKRKLDLLLAKAVHQKGKFSLY